MTYIKSKKAHLTHTSHRHSLPSCHTQWHPHPMYTCNEKPQPHIPRSVTPESKPHAVLLPDRLFT